MLIAADALHALARTALARAGAPFAHADRQADLLMEAEMRGLASHGLLRLPRIVERIHAGFSDPNTIGDASWAGNCFLRVDGRRGLGPVVAMAALEAIIVRARQSGIAIAAITNTNHLGALA